MPANNGHRGPFRHDGTCMACMQDAHRADRCVTDALQPRKRRTHKGPFQQFTEVCMNCWQNSYDSEGCVDED